MTKPEEDAELVSFDGPDGLHLIIEQSSRMCWAYLVDSDMAVLADVWLHNCVEAPDDPPWHSSSEPPFLNPKQLTAKSEWAGRRIDLQSSISVDWLAGSPTEAVIFVGSQMVAALAVGEKPGRCRFAAVDGPQAKVLHVL